MTLSGISAADLAMMQATTAIHRPTPCQILRITGTAPDGRGGRIDTWTVISSSGLLCRVSDWHPGREAVLEEALQAVDYWEIAVPWDTDVTAKDHVSVTIPVSATSSETLTYEVQSIGSQTFEIEHTVLCTRLVDVE